jgi:hypothetical protein
VPKIPAIELLYQYEQKIEKYQCRERKREKGPLIILIRKAEVNDGDRDSVI